MKKMMLMVASLVIVLSLISITSAQQAQKRFKGDGEGVRHPLLSAPWSKVTQLAEEIKLSDDQLKKVKGIRTELERAVDPLKTTLKTTSRDIFDLVASDDPSTKTEVMKLADTAAQLRSEMMKKRIEALYKLNEVLTDQQKMELREMKIEMRERREDRREERRERKMHRNRECYKNQDEFEDEPQN